jgi:hypothetical protein
VSCKGLGSHLQKPSMLFQIPNKKVHKMGKNMVTILLNLNIIMCHAFIKDQSNTPPLLDILNCSYDLKDEVPICSLHILSDEKQEWSKIETCGFHIYIHTFIAYIWFQSNEWFGLKLGWFSSSLQKFTKNEVSKLNAYNFVVYDSSSNTKWHFVDSPLKCPPLAK